MTIVLRPSNQPRLTVLRGGKASDQMDDAELISLCQLKDQAAFDVLVKRHKRNVYAMLYRLAPEWTDTDDLAQEVFIKIWRGIGKLHNPKAFKSWMAQIVTNLFYDQLRKRPRNTIVMSLDAPINGDEDNNLTRDIADPSAGPEQLYEENSIRKVVDAAIAQLPSQFRTALTLREVQDLPYEEIAVITGCEIGTVKSRIARARSKVQSILGPQFHPDQAA